MAVVFSHTGSPSNKTTAQKETIDHRRSHRLSFVSGGGWLCVLAANFGASGDEDGACFESLVGDASVSVGAAMLRLGLSTSHSGRCRAMMRVRAPLHYASQPTMP